jgi:hypothetical protein
VQFSFQKSENCSGVVASSGGKTDSTFPENALAGC